MISMSWPVSIWLARTSPGPLRLEAHALRPLAVHAQRDALDVEHDVGDVLEHARERGEFVQHALDLHRGDGRALQRRQQHAPQRVAERQAEAALERLGDDGGDALGVVAGLDRELLRLDQCLPVFLKHGRTSTSGADRISPLAVDPNPADSPAGDARVRDDLDPPPLGRPAAVMRDRASRRGSR